MDKREKIKSYLSITLAMLTFGTIGIFRKYVSIPSSLLACLRGLIGGIFLLLFCLITRRKSEKINGKTFLLMVFSGALIGVNWIFLFEAYNYTSVQIATLCYYMEPTIIILLSPFIFKEKMGIKKLACAITSLIGMALVSGVFDGFENNGIKGVIFGLIAALIYSSVVIINKKTEVKDCFSRTEIQLFSASIVLMPYVLLTENICEISFAPTTLLLVAIMGVVHTGIAYALYFSSVSALSSQSIAVISYLDPVSALLLSALILKESLSVFGVIGAVLLIGSSLISEINFKKKEKNYDN